MNAYACVTQGQEILVEGSDDDGLYLLYRGLVHSTEGVTREAHTIYPGAPSTSTPSRPPAPTLLLPSPAPSPCSHPHALALTLACTLHPAPCTLHPGAYFNEHALYSPPETGALFTAVAAEDCVLLRLSQKQRQRMNYQAPHDAYQLLLAVFKQVEMRNPRRRLTLPYRTVPYLT